MFILVMDESPERGKAIGDTLLAGGYERVRVVGPAVDLPAIVAESAADVILINVDAPTRRTLEQVAGVHRKMPRPIVMFTMESDVRTIQEAILAGVSAYIVDGMSASRLRPIIQTAMTRFREYRALKEELDRTRLALEERTLIERAKGVLMAQRHCGEAEAYHILRRLAMNQQVTIVEIARGLLSASEALDWDQDERLTEK